MLLVPPLPATPPPVTGDVTAPDIIRLHPIGARVGWARPVAVMPPVMLALREPVALNPHELGAGSRRDDIRAGRRRRFLNDDRRRRSADRDADGHLRVR